MSSIVHIEYRSGRIFSIYVISALSKPAILSRKLTISAKTMNLNVSRRELLVGSAAVFAATSLPSISVFGKGKNMYTPENPFTVGLMLFDNVVQLDATGPYEVLLRTPGIHVTLVAKTADPITAKGGMRIIPDKSFSDCDGFDMLLVPGGAGVDPLITDDETIAFIQRIAAKAEIVSAVCTGTLLLGAAGLLKGKKATTHWTTAHFKDDFGCEFVDERVVIDGNLITGAGVTSGIDFGFVISEMIAGREAAQTVMLAMEYDPVPPFKGGRPETTTPEILNKYKQKIQGSQDRRRHQIDIVLEKHHL